MLPGRKVWLWPRMEDRQEAAGVGPHAGRIRGQKGEHSGRQQVGGHQRPPPAQHPLHKGPLCHKSENDETFGGTCKAMYVF
jgi:hypothetical protein